jgi:hypothetical protein
MNSISLCRFPDGEQANIIQATTREIELDHNLFFLTLLPGPQYTFTSKDELERAQDDNKDDTYYDILADDLGDALDDSGAPRHVLHLKVGAPVQLLQTLDTSVGLTKGSNAIVHRCDCHSVVIRLQDTSTWRIPRTCHRFEPRHFRGSVSVRRHQLPFTLNWASTVHRVQGDTLKRTAIDLRHPIFCHGQLFVALTRSHGRQSTFLLLPSQLHEEDSDTAEIDNVVISDLFHFLTMCDFHLFIYPCFLLYLSTLSSATYLYTCRLSTVVCRLSIFSSCVTILIIPSSNYFYYILSHLIIALFQKMNTSAVQGVYPSWLSADRAAARGLNEKSMLKKEHWISLSAYNLWLGSAVDFCSQLGYTCQYSSTKPGYQDSFANRTFDTFPANTFVTKMILAAFNETTRGSAEDQLSQVQRLASPRWSNISHLSLGQITQMFMLGLPIERVRIISFPLQHR